MHTLACYWQTIVMLGLCIEQLCCIFGHQLRSLLATMPATQRGPLSFLRPGLSTCRPGLMLCPIVQPVRTSIAVKEADRRQLAHERIVVAGPIRSQFNVLGRHAAQVAIWTVCACPQDQTHQ
ncbi:hypothetical protein D7Y57_05260 [Stenotrophomonas maltophilia]|nr:hypothetical protein DF40_003000 [Stenotrophomonas maltophilia M30]MBA0455549.1 hypothetical protein [Stenotrophomonas maltophilia]